MRSIRNSGNCLFLRSRGWVEQKEREKIAYPGGYAGGGWLQVRLNNAFTLPSDLTRIIGSRKQKKTTSDQLGIC